MDESSEKSKEKSNEEIQNPPETKGAKIKKALYLIPNTLGNNDWQKVLPSYNNQIIKGIKHFIVESRKEAVRFLVRTDKSISIEDLSFYELNEHTDLKNIGHYLDPIIKQKLPMGVISDAGCPAVADPGAAVVQMAQKKNVDVIPLVGPSSIIMSVMASGFNGQSFAFNGYLPVKANERISRLHQLENKVYKENQTQLFIEAPYRNLQMLSSITHSLKKETLLCIAAGITTENEYIHTHTIDEWKKIENPPIQKVPAIFLIYHQ